MITYIMQKQRKPGAWKERTLSTKSESISCRTEFLKTKYEEIRAFNKIRGQNQETRQLNLTATRLKHKIPTKFRFSDSVSKNTLK